MGEEQRKPACGSTCNVIAVYSHLERGAIDYRRYCDEHAVYQQRLGHTVQQGRREK